MDLSTKKMQVFINKTRSILKLYIIFSGGHVTICMYPTPPYATLCHQFWVSPSPPTPVTSFLNDLLVQFSQQYQP